MNNLDVIFTLANSFVFSDTTGLQQLTITANDYMYIRTANANRGIVIKAAVSQVSNIMGFYDSNDNNIANVNAKGNISQAIGSTVSLMTSVGLANIQTSSTGIGNAADTTDDTLFTYTLPLNSFSSNGKSLRSIAIGHLATNANLKRVKFYFAGTAIADSGAIATSNTDWLCSIDVTRIDATHVSCVGKFEGGGLTDSITVTPNLAVSDLTSNNSIIKITGASTVTGAANDVLSYQMRTEFMN